MNDIIDRVPIDTCVALDEGLEGNCREIVGANRCKRSTIPAEGRSDGVADVGSLHGYPWNFPSILYRRALTRVTWLRVSGMLPAILSGMRPVCTRCVPPTAYFS